MADLIQGLGLLEKFNIIFPFLFVLVLVYAVLSSTKALGDNKGINSIIALAVAIMFLFSKRATTAVTLMAPWFVILIIFMIFLIIGYKIFGATDADIMSVFKSRKFSYVNTWMWVLIVIIVIGAISTAFGEEGAVFGDQEPTEEQPIIVEDGITTTGEVAAKGESAFWSTLMHPKVLGLAVILLISMFTLQRLSSYE